MTSKIDHDIGGTANEYTERGFAIYGKVTDDRGNVTRVQRSSAMGGPYCYVFTQDAQGRRAYFYLSDIYAPAPHLTTQQARDLAAILLRFADDAEGAR